MTNKEAIEELKKVDTLDMPARLCEAYYMSIKALEQEPCDDAISRDMALEKMADYVASGYADSVEDFEAYSRIICQLPPVNPQEPKWIPVSERLPERSGYYLTTNGYHEVYSDYWEGTRFDCTDVVIAWMPLPKPYELQESEEV